MRTLTQASWTALVHRTRTPGIIVGAFPPSAAKVTLIEQRGYDSAPRAARMLQGR